MPGWGKVSAAAILRRYGTIDAVAWRGADRALLTSLVQRLGDDSVLQRVTRWRAG